MRRDSSTLATFSGRVVPCRSLRNQRSGRSQAILYASKRRCILHDHSLEIVPYEQAWELQKYWVAEAGAQQTATGDSTDRLIILQHAPVYTLGTGSTVGNLRFPENNPPFPLHRTERGGEVTYHGPGQLVVYPILNLRHHRQDLHWYLRSLEEAVIRSLDLVHGLESGRVEGLTGVWSGGAKVCAMGVRAAKWVTYHGLALNVVNDLSPFLDIVPCGIEDKPVTSVRRLLDMQPAATAEAGRALASPTDVQWGAEDEGLLLEYAAALVESLGEVFGLAMETPTESEAVDFAAWAGAGFTGGEGKPRGSESPPRPRGTAQSNPILN